SNMPVPKNLNTQLLKLLPILFESIAFFLIYLITPNQVVLLRHALIGTLVSTFLFEISKKIFTIYVVNFDSYQVIYGALWVIPVFFVWVFISWLVVLVGACITAEIPAIRFLKR
ncbi:MAG: YihY family inner membrane protein, partial [Nitrospinaceae bacterium]|nr:YihY family inner membrane protein [Nitrospinaceae bacterium]